MKHFIQTLSCAAFAALFFSACNTNAPTCCCCGGGTEEPVLLRGEFSVSENHKVRFAPGNLYYTGETWRFYDEQFLYHGYGSTVSSESTPRDLFMFGQTGYIPTTMSQDKGTLENLKKISQHGGYNKNTSTRENIDGTNWDWGIRFGIENGGNQPGMWRTLSKKEWKYLLEDRPNAERLKMPAMVAGRRGYLLLPDNYSHPNGVVYPDFEGSYTADQNIYCYEDWKKMEAGGAIFLPCAGVKKANDETFYPERCGYYWTTTIAGTTDINNFAVQFGFKKGETDDKNLTTPQPITLLGDVPAYYRCAVRLAQEIR